MRNKKLAPFIVVLIAVFLFLVLIQYLQYKDSTNISCGGDWSYNVKCPVGSYCKSLNQGPMAGGICTPYLAGFFRLFNLKPDSTLVKITPETGIPTPTQSSDKGSANSGSVLSQTSTSPDGSYVVNYRTGPGDLQKISIVKKNGAILFDNIIEMNQEKIWQKMAELGLKGRGQLSWEINGWKNNTVFNLKILTVEGSEFTVEINALTGKINESTFVKVK